MTRTGAGLGAERRASPLPCLFVTITSNPSKIVPDPLPPKADINLSAYAKKAETLFINLDGLIRRVGIERVGFVTLTFAERIVEYKDASKRFKFILISLSNPRAWNLLPCLNDRSLAAFTSILRQPSRTTSELVSISQRANVPTPLNVMAIGRISTAAVNLLPQCKSAATQILGSSTGG